VGGASRSLHALFERLAIDVLRETDITGPPGSCASAGTRPGTSWNGGGAWPAGEGGADLPLLGVDEDAWPRGRST